MIPLNGPAIVIRVNHEVVDEIMVYPEYGNAWKIDGWKGGKTVWWLDQLQDRFDSVVQVLAEYVGEKSAWFVCDTQQPVSAWEALTMLTSRGGPNDPSVEG